MVRVILCEMALPDGLTEEAIKAFLEEAIENALISPAGGPMWRGTSLPNIRPTFKVVEVT